jgi:hypothetical protein
MAARNEGLGQGQHRLDVAARAGGGEHDAQRAIRIHFSAIDRKFNPALFACRADVDRTPEMTNPAGAGRRGQSLLCQCGQVRQF